MENALNETGRTVIDYAYDQLGRVCKETRVKFQPEADPEEDGLGSKYADVEAWTAADHDDVNNYLAKNYVIVQHYQKFALMALKTQGGE